ncbi:TRAP transporter large permease [Limoniibacter endophyticus]|uniref:TRAP transporter large permease protein n=1 Tax=Limoniibacter endophyticus TaxID=1565040 RepID=A0A8J3DHB3_9HYPH|nr:TRAP transporter large permease [Limoniibacter endophyticus]GHC67681.1 C4-dicarboxylate ABC transporter permease [Limoniibacter endophyticus]
MIIILFASFFVLLAIGVPVAFTLAISTWVAVVLGSNYPQIVVIKEMFSGLDSFPLLAVPFFILAAELMTGGALTHHLLRLATQFVGHFRGGLGYASILSTTLFAGISGSALAAAAGPGAMTIRMMEKSGYEKRYASALASSVAVVDPIIPPSITMIIYALQDSRVSVGGLFMAGVMPGLLIALAMCAVNFYVARKRGYRSMDLRPTAKQMVSNTLYAIPALMLIVIVVGGIRLGWFTPTEASVIAVFYALFCGLCIYRSLKLKDLPEIIFRAALVTVGILLILASARAFAWVLIIEGVPQALADTIISWNLSPIAFLLAINVLLLVFGMFMDPLPGVMILVPILAPIAYALGIDPIHFAMVVIVNLTIGLITPPVGALLFVVSSVVKIRVSEITREMPPFLLTYLVILMLLTFWPALSTWLPHVTGF